MGKNRQWRRRAALLLTACCVQFQSAALLPMQRAAAIERYANAVVANQGSAEGDAVIRGANAAVTHDSTLGSDVLDLRGDSFGGGWLQLPAWFGEECGSGFTVSLKYKLDSDASSYSRLFQFTPVPFGMGNTQGYNSPDISLDLNDKKSFRTSVFVGAGTTTENDDKHRAIFTLDAAPDSGKWHTLTAVYAKGSAKFYIDGKVVANGEADTLTDTMTSLFSEKVLSSYVYNAIGHSVYTDRDIRGQIDDVALYGYALTAAQAASLPDDPLYLYTFEADTITEGDPEPEQETGFSDTGAALTSVPELYTESPSGKLITKIWKDAGGAYYYSVHMTGANAGTVIQPSKLGIVTNTEDLSSGFACDPSAAVTAVIDDSYTMPYGKHSHLRDNCNELTFPLVKGSSTLTVTLRVYDDGMAYRYALNHGATIKSEASQVVFPGNSTFWGNGPNATYEWNLNEMSYENVKGAWADYSVPLTGLINNRYWVLLTEASVFNEEDPYCAGCLRTVGGSATLNWKFGVKTESVTMGSAFRMPWRAAIISDTLNGMSSSDLVLNLNPPCVLDDISWVKPGKVAWSWWSSGGDSPVEYHTQKDYIDFAAENGWDYVCLDFGWALWDDSAAKVKELCEYGAERGIGIYLWYGVNNKGHSGYKDSAGNPAYPYYSLLDEATIVREFERISGLGVRGVKVDYYESDTPETMKQMYWCMTIAAKNHLMVLFHGCTLPRGESRTYPHVVSYEAVNGTEFYKWFDSPSLENRVSYTFTRNVVGSADFTPTGIPIMGIKATAGFALADVVTIESGVQHFAHSVYTYEGNAALPFLNDVPVRWDDMAVLDGRPMQFNVTGRRSGDTWYVGASTIKARNIEVKLADMISDDRVYTAYIYGDNADGSELVLDVIENLTKESVIKRSLLANGGCVMKITTGGMKTTTLYSNYQFYEAEDAQLSGKAVVTNDKNGKYSSGGAYVGYVGGGAGNDVTFRNITVDKEGDYDLRIYYVSGEYRSLKVDVNGAFAVKLDGLYANRNDWSGIAARSTTVHLKAGENTIKLYNDQGTAPSIDRIAIAIPNPTLRGDVNADGKVNLADAVMMSKWLARLSDITDWRAGDLNEDKCITAADLSLLKQLLMK